MPITVPSNQSLDIDNNTVYIVKLSDQHNMECINASDNTVKMLSGFTGSMAIIFITKQKKYIMTDSRYYLQVSLELKSDWQLLKFTKDWMTIVKERFGHLTGIYDSESISLSFYNKLQSCIKDLKQVPSTFVDSKIPSVQTIREIEQDNFTRTMQMKINISNFNHFLNTNLVKSINYNQLETTNLQNLIFELPETCTGEPTKEKITRIRDIMRQHNIDHLLISDLNDIAWLFNIRAFSYEFNPVPKCYSILHKDLSTNPSLYLDEIHPFKHALYNTYSSSLLLEHLSTLNTLSIDPNTLSMKIANGFPSSLILETKTYSQIGVLKCIKNTQEISVLKKVHLMDSLAILKFWKHFEEEKSISSEKELSEKLEYFRKQNKYYLLPSFSSIIAKGSNASIVHYNPFSKFAPGPTENTALKIDLTLCDIGGQYINGGTTDVTRVFVKPSKLKDLKEENRKDLEDIKKAYTALIKAKLTLFNKEKVCGVTKGSEFHEIVSNKMKEFNYTYGHGTGHGIGNLGAVHEGPVGLYGENDLPSSAVTSVEPGYYEDGNFGLRLEDAVFTEKKEGYMKFNILTKVPYEIELINKDMLDKWELEHINNYHTTVKEELLGYIENAENNSYLEVENKQNLICFIQQKCKEL
eukprot:GAHX01001876.1.p1 GENE.GAHX01001876.1~~GAHX01001876.1.p1  ORF type:complete len:638 (-),score=134.45 GAHX01001876.1:704-2617(-)